MKEKPQAGQQSGSEITKVEGGIAPSAYSVTKDGEIVCDSATLYIPNLSYYSETVKPFPTNIFPLQISSLITEASKSVGCPPDFIGVPILAVLATAIGTSRSLLIKKGWSEGPRIYCTIIAEPGSKKSPALNIATKPIALIQDMLLLAYNAEKKTYLHRQAQYEIDLSAWKNQPDRAAENKPQVPSHPTLRQIKTSDATMEAISKLLAGNQRGILFEQDELAAWVKSMNAYRGGQGADLEYWLSFWSGSQCIINRASQPDPIFINNPIVNVTGCIQPDLLTTLSGLKNNGFFDRILLSYPNITSLDYTEDELKDEVMNGFFALIQSLFLLAPKKNELDADVPLILNFSIESRRLWVKWNKAHNAEMNSFELPYYLKGVWSKLQAYMARFILILQLAENAATGKETMLIEPETVDKAHLLVNYFKSHVYKTYREMHNSEMDHKITLAVSWISRKGGSASARMILSNNVAKCRSSMQVQELFIEMEERGIGSIHYVVPAGGGRRSTCFRLNDPSIGLN